MSAYGVYDADGTVLCYDARLLLDSVFVAFSYDDVVVLFSTAHFHYLCMMDAEAGINACRSGVQPELQKFVLRRCQFLPEFEVFACETLVLLVKGKIVANVFRRAPYFSHKALPDA